MPIVCSFGLGVKWWVRLVQNCNCAAASNLSHLLSSGTNPWPRRQMNFKSKLCQHCQYKQWQRFRQIVFKNQARETFSFSKTLKGKPKFKQFWTKLLTFWTETAWRVSVQVQLLTVATKSSRKNKSEPHKVLNPTFYVKIGKGYL